MGCGFSWGFVVEESIFDRINRIPEFQDYRRDGLPAVADGLDVGSVDVVAVVFVAEGGGDFAFGTVGHGDGFGVGVV